MSQQTVLRYKQLTAMLNVSRSTLARWIATGGFPKPIALSTHAVGFLSSDVSAWLDSRKSANA